MPDARHCGMGRNAPKSLESAALAVRLEARIFFKHQIPACRQAGTQTRTLVRDIVSFMYWVYAISSEKLPRIYVGMSSDIERRVSEHNAGRVFSTKGYTPWKLIYFEKCGINRGDARLREKYLKSGVGKEFLKKYIPG